MKTTKILNTAAVCLLAIGFKGQSVTCHSLQGFVEANTTGGSTGTGAQQGNTSGQQGTGQSGSSQGQAAAGQSGNDAGRQDAGQSGNDAVAKAVESPKPASETQTTGAASDTAKGQPASEEVPTKVVKKTLEQLREELKAQRERVLVTIMGSDGPFTILQLIDFLRIVDTDLLLKVDEEKVKKAGEKIKKYLESLGIGGNSVEESLDELMKKVYDAKGRPTGASTSSDDSEELKTLLPQFVKDIVAEQEHHGQKEENQKLVLSLGEKHKALLKQFADISPTFLTSEDVSGYLATPEYGRPMNAAKWKEVEDKISKKLESSGLASEVSTLVADLVLLREKLMDLLYGPIGHGDCPEESGEASGSDKPSFAAVPSSLCAIVLGIIVSMF
uniref:Merozoite surface protein 37/41 n=1 Tax=Babesia capreoli TaxID=308426 RepID=E2CT67_9APIC|nr:merozoite surface protein 37/41 [Babesia capreoli]